MTHFVQKRPILGLDEKTSVSVDFAVIGRKISSGGSKFNWRWQHPPQPMPCCGFCFCQRISTDLRICLGRGVGTAKRGQTLNSSDAMSLD